MVESGIVIMEKPESVSWDEIHELIDAAHSTNRAAGINMVNSAMTGEQLRKRIGSGKCFVAYVNGVLAGTCSLEIREVSSWYSRHSKVAHLIFDGVRPEFRGLGVYAELSKYREQAARDMGIRILDLDTAENNKRLQQISKSIGFRKVGLRAYRTGYYSVKMAKWMDECPFSERYIRFRYMLSSLLTKVRYSRRGTKRFGI